MKKRFSLIFIIVGTFVGLTLYWQRAHTPVPNPDPNHTHADFAVWMDGERLDFSADKFMSGLSTDETTHDEAGEHNHEYLHLHDNNPEVIHRHKPELTIGEFFSSLPDVSYSGTRFTFEGRSADVRLFVNGLERTEGSAYVFEDIDVLLLTDATEAAIVQQQMDELSDEACLYSRTCPWRGDPPTENCIADPTVPCVVQ